MGSMPKEVRLHQAWVTHHGERSVSPPRPSTEPACKGSPRADTLDSGQYQRRALGGADPQVMAPVESPAKVLQRILRLPARTKRVGGGYRDVPYSSDDLLRLAVAALLALQPELKSEQQARLQAEAALAEERTRMDKAVLDSEHMARQSAMSAHEIAQLQDKVKRLEEGRQVVGELKAERQARMQAEARLGDERVKLELAVQERDKLAEQVNSVKREVAELRDQVSKLDNAKHLEGELRARMETGLLSQYKQKVQELSMTLEAETERRSLLERRLESGSKAAITLVKSIPRVRSTSPRGSPLSITVSIANEGSTSDDAARQAALAIADGKWDTWLEIALERIHACAHRIDSDAEAIEELQRQLMREEARCSSAMEAQLTEQVSVKAELQAQIVAEQEKRRSLEQSAHELQAELIRSTRELASLRLQTLEAEIMSNVSPMGSAERNSAAPDGSPTALQSSAERGSSPRRREVAASIFNEQLAEEATRRYTSLLKDKAEADAERRQEQEEHKAEAEAQMARVTIDQLNRLQKQVTAAREATALREVAQAALTAERKWRQTSRVAHGRAVLHRSPPREDISEDKSRNTGNSHGFHEDTDREASAQRRQRYMNDESSAGMRDIERSPPSSRHRPSVLEEARDARRRLYEQVKRAESASPSSRFAAYTVVSRRLGGR